MKRVALLRRRFVGATLAAVLAAGGCSREGRLDAAPGSGAAAEAHRSFDERVLAVERYMREHDASNTAPTALKAALTAYGRDFDALAARAKGTDPALAARCVLAAESMRLYAASLEVAGDDPRALERALAAEEKWRRAKGGAASPPTAARR